MCEGKLVWRRILFRIRFTSLPLFAHLTFILRAVPGAVGRGGVTPDRDARIPQ